MGAIYDGHTQQLLEEVRLRIGLGIEGINFEKGLFDDVAESDYDVEKNYRWDEEEKKFIVFQSPTAVKLSNGIGTGFRYQKKSLYTARKENDGYSIWYLGKKLSTFTLLKRPGFYSHTTSDGVSMKDIARENSQGSEDKCVVVAYSEECAVKDKGETCLFCCFNRKRADEDQPVWKNPKQIAETIKQAYSEGAQHLTITGGFIPERREVEYYLDVAEHIREELGVDNFHGTACIGAPLDLSVIEKYKEAGFETIAFNTEVWGKKWFEVYCAGKVTECGGYDNWLAAIKYATEVFGKGKVRSLFVAGLQPKEVLFEGIETLADWGVVAVPSPWAPLPGSPLEGHRSPELDWHYNVQLKAAEILHNNGITYEDIFYAMPGRFPAHDLAQILYHQELQNKPQWNIA